MTTRAYEWNALKCGTAAVARPSSCPSPLLSLNDRWRRQFGLDLAWSLGQTGIEQTSWMKVWSCKSPRDNVNFFICQEMLRFVAVLSCSLLVPSMANKCFVVAWCGLALLACGGAVCKSGLSCFVLAALGIELQQICRPAHTVYVYIYIYIYSTQRAYYTCYIHVLRWFQYLTSIEQDSYWLLFLLYIVSCITFDAFSIIEVFQCILMPQECIHCILLLHARVDKWALQFFFIDLGLHSCGFLMKCIVQMAYVFLSVKDCEGIWVMPARFVIAQTSGALFADAVLCWRECHGTHGRSIHFSGRELNVPVPSWDQIGPNCIMRIRLL